MNLCIYIETHNLICIYVCVMCSVKKVQCCLSFSSSALFFSDAKNPYRESMWCLAVYMAFSLLRQYAFLFCDEKKGWFFWCIMGLQVVEHIFIWIWFYVHLLPLSTQELSKTFLFKKNIIYPLLAAPSFSISIITYLKNYSFWESNLWVPFFIFPSLHSTKENWNI